MIFQKGLWSKDAATPEPEPTLPSVQKPTSAPMPPVSMGQVLGIDVSHYQAGIDWSAVASAGYKFAFAKCSDGLSADPTFQTFRTQAKAAGLLFGGYHFFRFDIDPVLQAQKAFATSGGGLSGELPFFLDVEWDKQSQKYGEGTVMDDVAADEVYSCLKALRNLMGECVGIYTNPWFWNPGVYDSWSAYPLWVPAYNTTIDKVKIPPPWTSMSFWQYSESIALGGVTNVDGNYFLGSINQLKALVKP